MLDSYYFALGADGAYIVCDMPDNVAAAAAATSAAATGMVVNQMVALSAVQCTGLQARSAAPGRHLLPA